MNVSGDGECISETDLSGPRETRYGPPRTTKGLFGGEKGSFLGGDVKRCLGGCNGKCPGGTLLVP